jgi:predicted DNA-binding transcriptional regulator YafY
VALKFTCRGSHEVSAWVASWRDHVTVIEPAALREEFAELAEWLWEKYRSKKPVTGKK